MKKEYKIVYVSFNMGGDIREGAYRLQDFLNDGWVIEDKTEGNQHHATFFILSKEVNELQPK